MEYRVGFDLTVPVLDVIRWVPATAWTTALDANG